MKHKNLVFLGTSHIARQSLEEVAKAIEEEKPDIIALELDQRRLFALMQKGPRKIELKMIRKIGVKGFLFSLLGAWAEKKLGKIVGVTPGSEMKGAVRIAKSKKISVALVDQDIEITLKRLSKNLTWREKYNFLVDVLKAVFSGKKEIEFDLTKVPEKRMIKKLIQKLKERYPSVYKALIEERNAVIANNLKNLMNSNDKKKILVILGAGHIDEVLELLKKREVPSISYRYSIDQDRGF